GKLSPHPATPAGVGVLRNGAQRAECGLARPLDSGRGRGAKIFEMVARADRLQVPHVADFLLVGDPVGEPGALDRGALADDVRFDASEIDLARVVVLLFDDNRGQRIAHGASPAQKADASPADRSEYTAGGAARTA